MTPSNRKSPRESATLLRSVFTALRRHNEHRRRVAQMLEDERVRRLNPERERRLDQVIQARRKQRPHQAR